MTFIASQQCTPKHKKPLKCLFYSIVKYKCALLSSGLYLHRSVLFIQYTERKRFSVPWVCICTQHMYMEWMCVYTCVFYVAMAPVLKPQQFPIHSTSHPHKHPVATPLWFVYELCLFKQSPHRRLVSSCMTMGDLHHSQWAITSQSAIKKYAKSGLNFFFFFWPVIAFTVLSHPLQIVSILIIIQCLLVRMI